MKGTQPIDPLLRLIRRTRVDEDGCWNWVGSVSRDGYGRIRIGSKTNGSSRLAATHRLIYECFSGKIPNNREINHLCQNTRCVNPWHLEVVTHKTNMSRGKHAQKTHCIHGHEFTEENIYIRSTGGRHCKFCTLMNANRRYQQIKQRR